MGANQCRCSPGWYGRSCSITYCTRLSGCSACVKEAGCGWCDARQTCLPGNASETNLGHCDTWFFHECVTTTLASKCSSQISVLDCSNRYCKETANYGNMATCQQCKDVEHCYSKALATTKCSSWNETRCPNGEVKPDYDDPHRIETTVFSDGLKTIKPEDSTLYVCSTYDHPSEDIHLLVAAGRLNVKAGDIVASAQAGGVFHKLHEVTHVSQFTMMRAKMASLREAIRYADFSADFQTYEIDDRASLEQTPPAALYDDVISGRVDINGTVVHSLDNSTVKKCRGRTYQTSGSVTATSVNLVIEVDPTNNTTFQVGDILTSNTSSGFLETVLGVWSTSVGTVVKTTLTECDNLDVSKLRLSSPVRSTSCVGGDNNPGLLIYDKLAQINLNVGDVVSGRESAEIFAKVLKVRYSGNFVILEVASVERVENGTAVTQVTVEDVTEGHVVERRKRDIDLPISGSYEQSLGRGVSKEKVG